MPQPCLKQFPKILQTKVNCLQTYRGNKSCTPQTCHLLKVICCFLPLNSSAVFKRCTSPFDLFILCRGGKKEKYRSGNGEMTDKHEQGEKSLRKMQMKVEM